MRVRVYITPKKGVLDPQAKAVERSLHALGFDEVSEIHLGKYLEISLATESREEAERRTDEMCRKLLANAVIEDYRFDLEGE